MTGNHTLQIEIRIQKTTHYQVEVFVDGEYLRYVGCFGSAEDANAVAAEQIKNYKRSRDLERST